MQVRFHHICSLYQFVFLPHSASIFYRRFTLKLLPHRQEKKTVSLQDCKYIVPKRRRQSLSDLTSWLPSACPHEKCGERHKKAYDAKKQIVCPGGGYPRKSGYQKKMTAKNYQERAQKEALAKEGKGESWPGFEVHNAVVQVELDQKVRITSLHR